MLLYKSVVLQVRIRFAYPIYFFDLSGREFFMRIETPSPLEQSLPPQDLMNSRNAAAKLVRRIKDCGVCIGNLLRERQQVKRNQIGLRLHKRQMIDGSFRPHRPVSQQPTRHPDSLMAEIKGRKKIIQNIVVISRV